MSLSRVSIVCEYKFNHRSIWSGRLIAPNSIGTFHQSRRQLLAVCGSKIGATILCTW